MTSEQKTIVITGATGGIGLQTAIGLSVQGHRVVITGRDRTRGELAVEQVKAASGRGDVHLALADLSRGEEIARLASSLGEKFPEIDVLINNAGMLAPRLPDTDEAFDADVAVNVLAPWLLTRALLPYLEAAAPARVINVTGGRAGGPLNFDELDGEKAFVAMNRYGATKAAMEAATLVLARELAPRGVYVNLVFPGSAATSMTKAVAFGDMPWFMKPFWPLFAASVRRDDGGASAAKAARSSIWAATAPETVREAGVYYDSKATRARLHASVLDADNQERVLDRIRRSQPRREG